MHFEFYVSSIEIEQRGLFLGSHVDRFPEEDRVIPSWNDLTHLAIDVPDSSADDGASALSYVIIQLTNRPPSPESENFSAMGC